MLGCGKTTQVAQFILDQEILAGRGSTCRIVCTQPRRISAISVAERVADERSEKCGRGFSTGYQIRLEKKLPRSRGSILFCTTGILLEWMKSDQTISCVSHLVLDEIHERDVLSDFVITILKGVLPKRPDLKVILMSATLNAEHFSQYYDNCPFINIPGFTFPVQEYYLEDVLELTKFRIAEGTASREPQGWQKHLKRNKEKVSKIQQFKDWIAPHVRQLQHEGKYSPDVLKSLSLPESEELNVELVAALTLRICISQGVGAILIFLPGWSEISNLHRLLTESGKFPSCVRKIIIATSIAETSITIDDVVYVIDCGKIKMKNFDVKNNIATLEAEWVTLANARQRKGRAGRVQPGICYHLYSKAREMMLREYPLPEMLRSRLEEVILQIKMLCLGKVRPFLEKVMNPPDPRAVDLSLRLLQTLNAIDSDENLTPLGFHLARLPLDPQTGKMILLGAMFSCVDPIFSVAASLGFKDAFVIPLGKEKEVDQKKQSLARGCKSDHLVLVEAMKRWESLESQGRDRGRQFCWDYFLSSHTLGLLRAVGHNANRLKVETPEDGRVCIHPKSVNEKERYFESPFLVYHLKLRSTAVFLHDTTVARPLPLLFFGEGPVRWYKDERGFGVISINSTVKFNCRADTADLVKKLRSRLDDLLEDKIAHPGITDWSSNSEEGKLLRAIVELITSEDEKVKPVGRHYGDDDSDSE
ncbi:hypothetical protein J437_LFUL013269 [Ladona fulva]|uniref:RNA helicase n=1 Tax=Ladona fulva TaxID=123851 RepID=A0A8K0KE42_LADFU|nr:hypothetical protein J437_LFUL013269 [Ladona fulva]